MSTNYYQHERSSSSMRAQGQPVSRSFPPHPLSDYADHTKHRYTRHLFQNEYSDPPRTTGVKSVQSDESQLSTNLDNRINSHVVYNGAGRASTGKLNKNLHIVSKEDLSDHYDQPSSNYDKFNGNFEQPTFNHMPLGWNWEMWWTYEGISGEWNYKIEELIKYVSGVNCEIPQHSQSRIISLGVYPYE